MFLNLFWGGGQWRTLAGGSGGGEQRVEEGALEVENRGEDEEQREPGVGQEGGVEGGEFWAISFLFPRSLTPLAPRPRRVEQLFKGVLDPLMPHPSLPSHVFVECSNTGAKGG